MMGLEMASHVLESEFIDIDEDSKLSIASGSTISENTEKVLIEDGFLTKDMINEENRLKNENSSTELSIKRRNEISKAETMKRYHQLQKLLTKSKFYTQYLAEKINKVNKKRTNQNENSKKTDDVEDENQNLKAKNFSGTSDEKSEETEDVEDENQNLKAKNFSGTSDEKSEEEEEVPKKRRKLTPLKEKNLNSKITKKCVVMLKDVSLQSSSQENSGKDIVPKFTGGEISSLFIGGTLRSYQIEGFNWLKALFENGLNGILGDEMGLGKTIQCIALFSHLIEKGCGGPFLIVAPLSTLPNWVSEFERFTPNIPVILYHGERNSRRQLISNYKPLKVGNKFKSFPVIVTSYEIVLSDQTILRKHKWKYIVVDEGQRIKNMNCQLIIALKSLTSSNRLLLTGTPLQNDLSELWSLLNFLLPELFHNLNVFESWFDVSSMMQEGSESAIVQQEQDKHIIATLREILDPFLLRRVKQDVELDLPPKREYLVYVSLTARQQEFYKAVVNKTIAALVSQNEDVPKVVEEVLPDKMQTRSATVKFRTSVFKGPRMQSAVTKFSYKNRVMDLRKCVMHPYLIEYPIELGTNDFKIDEKLVQMSGKLMVVDVLLKQLLPNKHKVLIFSQMVEMLNILHDFCYLRGYKFCRLDGTMDLDSRKDMISRFNDDFDTKIFLISTRAGGLGLNLVAADTVILFDSDWNPQCDLQAMARCHRIGQVKPVIIYRLVVANTIDEKMIKRAAAKRKLEKMIIHKDRKKKSEEKYEFSTLELLELLKSEDHDKVVYSDDSEIFSKEELNILLDRNFSNNTIDINTETFRLEILDN